MFFSQIKRYPVEALALAIMAILLGRLHPANPYTGLLAANALALCYVIGWWRLRSMARDHQEELELQADTLVDDNKVDIWQYQGTLMDLSDQRKARFPELNKTMLLYAAMQAEELAEQYKAMTVAMQGVLEEYAISRKTNVYDTNHTVLNEVRFELTGMQGALDDGYKRIKEMMLPNMATDVQWRIPLQDCVEILDGVTDVAVVTAGFSLAAGLPGPQAYVDVVGSNISKANPDTNKIDKDPSGKWIRGRDYVKPNLTNVLTQHVMDQ